MCTYGGMYSTCSLEVEYPSLNLKSPWPSTLRASNYAIVGDQSGYRIQLHFDARSVALRLFGTDLSVCGLFSTEHPFLLRKRKQFDTMLESMRRKQIHMLRRAEMKPSHEQVVAVGVTSVLVFQCPRWRMCIMCKDMGV